MNYIKMLKAQFSMAENKMGSWRVSMKKEYWKQFIDFIKIQLTYKKLHKRCVYKLMSLDMFKKPWCHHHNQSSIIDIANTSQSCLVSLFFLFVRTLNMRFTLLTNVEVHSTVLIMIDTILSRSLEFSHLDNWTLYLLSNSSPFSPVLASASGNHYCK